ncbi:copper homeostasis protein [Paenibacillus endophyticus]|uniref:PF03932 family protein CutC n=1 Tax=Paenibacillus endophyticus TaxID=1294268 RepID=A0A7W5GBQ8_9BACL|nr:copper homeostasis protein CutC [Paenibacillus endophyticus]MBB3153668.1 copper homeostasis protein [Paenibacillus endophyticus]
MILEVIATCIEDALTAEANGADRLELITAITEGGLTPGIGLTRQAAKAVKIPVFVMVRPHSRSFVYSKNDILTMAEEIKAIAESGAAGVVIGALTPEGRIDERALEMLLPLTNGLQVTFHRAFDELEDQLAGLRTLGQYPQIKRVLTSAGPGSAMEAIPAMRRLVLESQGGSVSILAGSGLKPQGMKPFIEQTGVTELHFGSAVRFGSDSLSPIDPAALLALSDSLRSGG